MSIFHSGNLVLYIVTGPNVETRDKKASFRSFFFIQFMVIQKIRFMRETARKRCQKLPGALSWTEDRKELI